MGEIIRCRHIFGFLTVMFCSLSLAAGTNEFSIMTDEVRKVWFSEVSRLSLSNRLPYQCWNILSVTSRNADPEGIGVMIADMGLGERCKRVVLDRAGCNVVSALLDCVGQLHDGAYFQARYIGRAALVGATDSRYLSRMMFISCIDQTTEKIITNVQIQATSYGDHVLSQHQVELDDGRYTLCRVMAKVPMLVGTRTDVTLVDQAVWNRVIQLRVKSAGYQDSTCELKLFSGDLNQCEDENDFIVIRMPRLVGRGERGRILTNNICR